MRTCHVFRSPLLLSEMKKFSRVAGNNNSLYAHVLPFAPDTQICTRTMRNWKCYRVQMLSPLLEFAWKKKKKMKTVKQSCPWPPHANFVPAVYNDAKIQREFWIFRSHRSLLSDRIYLQRMVNSCSRWIFDTILFRLKILNNMLGTLRQRQINRMHESKKWIRVRMGDWVALSLCARASILLSECRVLLFVSFF